MQALAISPLKSFVKQELEEDVEKVTLQTKKLKHMEVNRFGKESTAQPSIPRQYVNTGGHSAGTVLKQASIQHKGTLIVSATVCNISLPCSTWNMYQ